MKNSKQKSPRSWQRVVLSVVCVILAVIQVALIGLTIYAERMFGLMNQYDDSTRPSVNLEDFTTPVNTDPTAGEDHATEPVPGPADVIDGDHVINILLVGADNAASLADATILCTINTSTKTISLTSFARDMYVSIPDYFYHKFNTAYALGGFETLNATLEYNFGVQVDGNVAVNFDGFIDVIDAVGGVDIELTEDEAWYMNTRDWDGLDDSGWALTEGWNHLNGDQALAYSRIRSIDSDLARNNRQRVVLTALFNQCKDMNLFELNDLLSAVLPLITTDMSNSQIMGYVLQLFPMLSDLSINTQQIPVDDTWYSDEVEKDGGMYIIRVYDFEANRKLLAEIMSE